MEKIIYCYLDQINALQKTNSDWGYQSHWGVSFEKQGEGVYHTHTQMPDIVPSGIPIPTIFSILTYEQASTLNPDKICSELDTITQKQYHKTAQIYLFLSAKSDGNKLVKGYIKHGNSYKEAEIKYVPGKSQLYSRAKGILEHSVLENSKVSLVGLGSFGGYIAVELAKAGVGHYDLIDFDRLELANIARHQCGIDDLGRYKTNAVADLIHLKNPYANVRKYEIDINKKFDIFSETVVDSDLILCLTDNNESRNRINDYCLKNNKTAIFGRAITRAEAGDVFVLDGEHQEDAPCLACLIGAGLFKKTDDERTQFKRVREETPAYVSDEDVEATIQVGLSSDINPICNMIVKLSLLHLAKGKESGLDSVYEDLTAKYYLWVNRRENKYKNWEPMAFFANKPSILRWYGAKVPKNPICPSCNQEAFIEAME